MDVYRAKAYLPNFMTGSLPLLEVKIFSNSSGISILRLMIFKHVENENLGLTNLKLWLHFDEDLKMRAKEQTSL